jgi:hypothetical protein
MVLGLWSILLLLTSAPNPISVAFSMYDSKDISMADFNVQTAAELKTALTQAKAGDRILLAAGSYGAISLKGINFTSDVTIMSADAKNQAKIDTITITDSSHLVLKALNIGRPLNVGEPNHVEMGTLLRVSHVTLDGLNVHGSLDNDPTNDARGFGVSASNNVVVKNSNFEQLNRALVIYTSQDVKVLNNSFHDLRTAGVVSSATQRIEIAGNKIRDIYFIGEDHPDAIQFFSTAGAAASTDIIIRNNEILQGAGRWFQGIFLRDQLTNGPAYERVLIENNLVYLEAGYNAIAIDHVVDAKILNNSVLALTDNDFVTRINVSRTTNGLVQGNVAEAVLLQTENVNVTLDRNIILTRGIDWSKTFPDIYKLAAATTAGLVAPGYGFQLNGATPTQAPAPLPTPAPVPISDGPRPETVSAGGVVKPRSKPVKGGRIVSVGNAISAATKSGSAVAAVVVPTPIAVKTPIAVTMQANKAFGLDAFMPAGLASTSATAAQVAFGSGTSVAPITLFSAPSLFSSSLDSADIQGAARLAARGVEANRDFSLS